jgi:ABC-type sugar transport system permease subunit
MRELAITLLILAIVVSAGIAAMLDSKRRWYWRLAGMLPIAATVVTAVIIAIIIVRSRSAGFWASSLRSWSAARRRGANWGSSRRLCPCVPAQPAAGHQRHDDR